jgi:hypothetical protein
MKVHKIAQHYGDDNGRAICYGGNNCDITRKKEQVTCIRCLKILNKNKLK